MLELIATAFCSLSRQRTKTFVETLSPFFQDCFKYCISCKPNNKQPAMYFQFQFENSARKEVEKRPQTWQITPLGGRIIWSNLSSSLPFTHTHTHMRARVTKKRSCFKWSEKGVEMIGSMSFGLNLMVVEW